MRVRLCLGFLFLSIAALPLAAQQTKTFTLDCWGAVEGPDSTPCSVEDSWACGDTLGNPLQSCEFDDPLPKGSRITNIVAKLWVHQCVQEGSTWSASFNGQVISTITESRYTCTCPHEPCLEETHTSIDYPNGFPGYNYGGKNKFDVGLERNGKICIPRVDITVTYLDSMNQATITHTEPVVPRNSGLVNNCVQYRSNLTGVVTNNGQPVAGVNLRFQSDRGTPPDSFTQPSRPTDATGTATGRVATRRQGAAHISAANAEISTPNPAEIAFQEANWEPRFLMTAYVLANEADYHGPTVTNPCGLQGTWHRSFLYGSGVLMQGSGRDLNGNIITIDWAHSGSPLNASNVCFMITDCPHTASGACAQAGTTIAVDRTVVPMGASVNIQNIGGRVAQDTGNRIRGYHIDVFRGFGRAAMQGWGNFRGTVRYLSGGGQCGN